MAGGLELTFDTPIPVVGQVMILEAVDHLYSLMALGDTDWRKGFENDKGWEEMLATSPGKFLEPENALQAAYMYPGSAKEVVAGVAGPVEKLFEFICFYREKKKEAQIKNLQESLILIQQQLLPFLDKAKEYGVSERELKRIVVKAYQYIDEVLDALMTLNKVAIVPVSAETPPGFKCPACGTVSR